MGSLEFAPPYPCCGNITFHEKGNPKCEEYKTGEAPLRTPIQSATPLRFTWRTSPTVKDSSTGWLPRVEQGNAFRAVRVMYGLTLREVADGWGVPHVELGELERGHRHFTTPADMQAALSQLWLWAVEKNPRITQ